MCVLSVERCSIARSRRTVPCTDENSRHISLTPAVPHEGYHSLLLWSRLIEEEWTVQGKILPAGFVLEFQNEVVALYGVWWVEMRYRQPIAATAEAERFLRGVAWLRTNYTKLWS